MDYTYREYEDILKSLTDHGYVIKGYGDAHDSTREVILRHDVDISLEKAVKFAEIEKMWGGTAQLFLCLFPLISTILFQERLLMR